MFYIYDRKMWHTSVLIGGSLPPTELNQVYFHDQHHYGTANQKQLRPNYSKHLSKGRFLIRQNL